MQMTPALWLTLLLLASTYLTSTLTGFSGLVYIYNMSAKVPKCQCLSLQASSGKLVNPHLCLNGVPIPFSTGAVRFLGMQVQVPKNCAAAREAVLMRLQEMLQAIDGSVLTRKQKLLLYSGGVCPRLSLPLMIQEFSTTWMEQQVDSMVTGFLKR